MGRIWTQLEAWCSMQTVTPEGLRPANTEQERRYTIDCIHNAPQSLKVELVKMVARQSPQEMVQSLHLM